MNVAKVGQSLGTFNCRYIARAEARCNWNNNVCLVRWPFRLCRSVDGAADLDVDYKCDTTVPCLDEGVYEHQVIDWVKTWSM